MTEIIDFSPVFNLSPNQTQDHYGEVVADWNGGFGALWENVRWVGHSVLTGFGLGAFNSVDPAQSTRSGVSVPADLTTWFYDAALLTGGAVATVWQTGDFQSGIHLWNQILDRDGNALSPAQEVSANSSVTDFNVTALSSGGYVMTWGAANEARPEMGWDVFGRLCDADGNLLDGRFRLSASARLDQGGVQSESRDSGGFIAAWSQIDWSTSQRSFLARVFDETGHAATGQIRLATYAPQYNLPDFDISGVVDGHFAAVYRVAKDDDLLTFHRETLYLKLFDDLGQATSPALIVDRAMSQAGGSVETSISGEKVVALADGRFAIAWQELSNDSEGTSASVHLRVVNADGTTAAPERVFADALNTGPNPSLAALTDGRFVLSWSASNGSGHVNSMVQIFDARDAAINLVGTARADQFAGTYLADTIVGNDGADTILGGAGDDVLTGNAGGDVLRGGSGNDTLGGNFGDDRLFGEGGDDRMIGEADADTLTGGVGKDVFVFSAGSGADVVTDFDGARDRVDLSAYHFTSLALASAAFTDTADGLQFQVGADSLVMTGFTLAALAEANLII